MYFIRFCRRLFRRSCTSAKGDTTHDLISQIFRLRNHPSLISQYHTLSISATCQKAGTGTCLISSHYHILPSCVCYSSVLCLVFFLPSLSVVCCFFFEVPACLPWAHFFSVTAVFLLLSLRYQFSLSFLHPINTHNFFFSSAGRLLPVSRKIRAPMQRRNSLLACQFHSLPPVEVPFAWLTSWLFSLTRRLSLKTSCQPGPNQRQSPSSTRSVL